MLTFQRLKLFGKLYLGTTIAYGGWHAFQRERFRPVEQVCIVLAAPIVWPAYLAMDTANCCHTRPSFLSDDS